jgi:hypothetical protein
MRQPCGKRPGCVTAGGLRILVPQLLKPANHAGFSVSRGYAGQSAGQSRERALSVAERHATDSLTRLAASPQKAAQTPERGPRRAPPDAPTRLLLRTVPQEAHAAANRGTGCAPCPRTLSAALRPGSASSVHRLRPWGARPVPRACRHSARSEESPGWTRRSATSSASASTRRAASTSDPTRPPATGPTAAARAAARHGASRTPPVRVAVIASPADAGANKQRPDSAVESPACGADNARRPRPNNEPRRLHRWPNRRRPSPRREARPSRSTSRRASR